MKIEKLIEKEIKKLNLTEEEIKTYLKQLKEKPSKKRNYSFGLDKFKFGVISDSHIGHKLYDVPLMDHAAKVFDKEKVDFVVHAGDICEGWYTNRQGHVFELEHIGADEQIDRAIGELSKLNQPVYFITGNHTYNTFMKNAGIEVGKKIEDAMEGVHFLGNGEGDIELNKGIDLKLLHPDGGTAYAISYRSQKIAESLTGGEKPHIMVIGHYHKAEYIFYRNIHILQAGTLCSQTKFMRGKHIPAHKGFWVVEGKCNKSDITKFSPTFYPSYD